MGCGVIIAGAPAQFGNVGYGVVITEAPAQFGIAGCGVVITEAPAQFGWVHLGGARSESGRGRLEGEDLSTTIRGKLLYTQSLLFCFSAYSSKSQILWYIL